MKNAEYDVLNGNDPTSVLPSTIRGIVEEFTKKCRPIERNMYVFVDAKTGAYYCECHMTAEDLIKLCTIDVPLDPEEQPEYRANRDIVEDDVAFDQMKADAKEKRTFSNIVAEFDTSHNPKYPIKIIGGQHRFLAIKGAHDGDVHVNHGMKVYFGLTKEQRLDVQLISNTNIAASTDLYDRLQETSSGPQLREWSQDVGLLDPGKDFSAKGQRGNAVTVRLARSFILSYYAGKKVDTVKFEETNTTSSVCKSGKLDIEWEQLRKDDIWKDEDLRNAAKEFVMLDQAQRDAVEEMAAQDNTVQTVWADKALTLSVMTAWAYVGGILQSNKVRLQNHYDLKTKNKGRDPLNAQEMAKGRHKSDPANYRGLGTRNDPKERGRCVELFYLQAESGRGITNPLIDAAIKRHYTKQAKLESLQADKKVF